MSREYSPTSFHNMHIRPCLAELIGTLLYVFLDGFCHHLSPYRNFTYPIFSAATLLVLQFLFYKISNAHFNPGITLSYFVTGRMQSVATISYIVSQCIGAFLGATLHCSLSSSVIFEDGFIISDVVVSDGTPKINRIQAFILEMVLLTILALTHIEFFDSVLKTNESQIAVPAAWGLCCFISLPLLGRTGNIAVMGSQSLIHWIFTGDSAGVSLLYLNILVIVASLALTVLIKIILREQPIPVAPNYQSPIQMESK